jgi:CheY-like chemotaxis protein
MSTRILLVEDDDMCQEIVSEYAEDSGCTVDLASDGEQALLKISQHDYQLVLMDIMMPNMDGVEATRRIRAMEDATKSAVPIVAITARNPELEQETWFAAGINSVISKPFEETDLIRVLEQYS